MPHVTLVPFTGFRIREQELLEVGMRLPGLQGRATAVGQLPALGLLTLAGMTPPPWTVSYREAAAWGEAFVQQVLDEKPDLVAVSALTASVEEAYRFSARLRRHGVPVVIGGLHATACPEEASRHCDAVVAGEGEPVWREVLADAERRTLRSVYRSAAPFDLELAPVPRFDLLGTAPRPRVTVQTQRGCPFACEFCGASRLLGAFREKPLPRLEQELAAIARIHERPTLELADDNTFAGARPVEPLFEALERTEARYFTEADWRIGERPDVLRGLAQSGCVQVLVGIESLVFRYPGMGAKWAELARVMDALAAIQEAGVAVIGCFIVGADGETRASIDRMAEFALACNLADVQITLATPFPGTGLYRRLRQAGRLLPERGWSAFTLFDVCFQPDAMSVAELETSFRELLCTVFSSEASLRRQAIRKQTWRANPSMRRSASSPA